MGSLLAPPDKSRLVCQTLTRKLYLLIKKGQHEKMNIQNYCKTAHTNALSDDEMKIVLMARHEKNSNVRYIQLYQLRQK